MPAPRKKVVISEFMNQAAVQQLGNHFHVVYEPGLVDDPPALYREVADADALIVRNRTQVNRDVVAAGPGLRVVGRLGVGLDNIDLDVCREHNIRVIPATGANSRAVAEYVMGTAMMLRRGCYLASAEVARGAWPRQHYSSGREIDGATLGLIGFGGIGQMVAGLAQGLGMHVVAHDPYVPQDAPVWQQHGVKPLSLDELVTGADIISLHIPLTAGTRNLFNADVMAKMKAGSVLINTSRGGIVDEAVLVDALHNGHLAGAALDVFADEPLPPTPDFEGVPGLILTPHVAGVTQESSERVGTLIARSVTDFLSKGEA